MFNMSYLACSHIAYLYIRDTQHMQKYIKPEN